MAETIESGLQNTDVVLVKRLNKQINIHEAASRIIALFIPISCCMAIVVLSIRSIPFFRSTEWM